VRALRGQRPRAIILAASRADQPGTPELQTELAAVSRLGSRLVALGPGAGDAVRAVVIDNRGGARALGAALAERGYRSACVLAAADGVRTSDDRLAGFTEGFEAGGGQVDRVLRGGFSRESGQELVASALAAGIPSGTLVFAISDVMAVGALSALRAAGREIGGDVALAGFDDIPTAQDVTPGLTTVRVPLEEVGYQALRAAIDEEWTPDADLGLDVILRESTPER
jgi:LacI family transcriptional regulator